MTKKDYEAFASAIYRAKEQGESLNTINKWVFLCASVFETDNPLFQRNKFEKACVEGKYIRKAIRERF